VNTLPRTGLDGVLGGLCAAKTLPCAVGLGGVDAAKTLARVGLLGAGGGVCAATMLPCIGLVGALAGAALAAPAGKHFG